MSDYKQTKDAAGRVTSQYSQMLQNLNDDDLAKQLRETTHMYQADCELKMRCAARIEELEAQIKEDALQYLSDTGQMGEEVGDLTRRHQHALHKIDVLEDDIDVIKTKLQHQTYLIEQLLHLLDKREETDDGRIFHPNQLLSCRVADTEKLNKILAELRSPMKGQNDD